MQKYMFCVEVEAFVDMTIVSFAFRQKHLNRFGIKNDIVFFPHDLNLV